MKLEIARDEQNKRIEQLKEADKSKTAEIELLHNEIERLKQNIDKPSVAVKVRISKDFTLSIGQRLIYDEIVSNIGDAYNKGRSNFRAPVEGNYLISVTACSKSSDWGVLEIVHDEEVIGQVRSGDVDNYFDCNSEVTVTRMEAGSSVWVQYREGKSGIQNAYHWNSFTAILVH